jgi:hypothetical protein
VCIHMHAVLPGVQFGQTKNDDSAFVLNYIRIMTANKTNVLCTSNVGI